MTPERWQQIEEVFQAALDLPEGERAAYISASCAGDEELCAQVAALVAQHDESGDFIEEPAVAVSGLLVATDSNTNPMTGAFVDPAIGRRLGAYKIARELGRGGMGAVYLAERADSEFRRRVAIKLIKRGMDTDFILRRFRNERQILATLDHPHIAKLLDGGTTEEGLPYFVMEFIEGQPVYQYCDERRLSIPERLRLFAQVCDAVDYAHRSMVIHRDIKPSNIMVTPGGAPKLLDFGIAKVLNPEMAADITLDPTGTAMLLMTPEYAAPEQVRGHHVTPATDVYALGVLLYELLTGHRPYRLVHRSPHEIARVICEDEPLPPSEIVAHADGLINSGSRGGEDVVAFEQSILSRGSSVESLSRQLAGDLDRIVMKALSKAAERRYQSAAQLRDDIGRHLNGRPITAPTLDARAADTESDAPAETTLAVLPLKQLGSAGGEDEFLGVGLADALITRLSQSRRLVVRPTSSSARFRGEGVDPFNAGRELSADFILDGHIRRAADSIRVTIQLLDVRAGTTRWAAQFDEKFTDVLRLEDAITSQVAEAVLPQLTSEERRALARRPTESPVAYEAYMRGRYHWNTFGEDSYTKALSYFERAVELAPDYALAYAGIADYYNILGSYGVIPFADSSKRARDAALKAVELDPALADGYAALGFATLMHDFDWLAAERHLRRSLDLNPNYATGRLWYGYFLALAGRAEEAFAHARRALELDPLSPILRHSINWIYYLSRSYEESIVSARLIASDEPQHALSYVLLCLALSQVGRHEEAIEYARRAARVLGRTPYTLTRLAVAYARAGRTNEARAVLSEVEAMSPERYVSPHLLSAVFCTLNEREAAFAQLEHALSIRDARLLWLGVDPLFDTLRDDARYEEILRRTNNPAPRRTSRQTGELPPVAKAIGGRGARRRAATADRTTGAFSTGARTTGGQQRTGEKSLAVLPLKVVNPAKDTADGDDEYLGVGLADALVARLSAVQRLVVRPTSSVLRYAEIDPLEAGRQLGVDYVVTGTIRRAGQSIRVSSQLLDVREGATRWARKFDGKAGDVLQLEDTLSEQLASALVPHLTGDEQRELQKRGTENPEAYEAYLRGRFYWNTFTEEGFAKALVSYSRAIAIDPNYAAPHSGIADYYNWLGVYGIMPFAECSAAAKEAARKAVELDPTSAEAYSALGFATITHDFDWQSAERQHLRALELNPKYATAHQWYGFHLAMEGRFDESVAAMQRARALDPLTPSIVQGLGWVHYHARQFDEALADYRQLLDIEPNFAYGLVFYSWALRHVGRHDEAVKTAQKAVEIAGAGQFFVAALAAAFAAGGHEQEARAALAQLRELAKARYVSPYHLAIVHLYLGERDRTIQLLEEAHSQGDGWLVWLGVEPQFDTLRSEPRFENLLRRTNNPALAARPAQEIDPTTGQPLSKPRTSEDEEARQLYQAARYFATKRTAEGLRQAIERLERAVARDPSFALAHAELADCYALLNWYVEPPPADAWACASKSAYAAVEADDRLAVAHASLGFVKCHFERDWTGAETELRRAVDLDPENTVARRWHAFNLSAMGRHEEALAEVRRAQEITPRSPVAANGVANVLFLARRFDEAVEACQRALEIDPGSVAAHVVLRWAYEKKGMREDALAIFEQEKSFAGDTPTTRAKRAHVLAACGRREEAREILQELMARRDDEWVTSYEIAVINSLLGERDEAFRWLLRAEEEHAVGFTFVAVDPHLDALRDDPRFKEMLRRLKSPAA